MDTPVDTKGAAMLLSILKVLLILHSINHLGEHRNETVQDEQPQIEAPFLCNCVTD